jgi:hypothetical protein
MNVSLREVVVLAENALLGSGVDRGCARAAARLVVSMEIEHGAGLVLLHDHLRNALDPKLTSLHADELDPRLIVLRSRGASALLVLPAALDFLSVMTRHHGFGAVVVTEVRGVGFAMALEEHARRRNLRLDMAVGAPTSGDLVEPLTPPRRWLDDADNRLAASSMTGSVVLTANPWPVATPHSGPVDHLWDPRRGYEWIVGEESALELTPAEDCVMRAGLDVDETIWAELSSVAARVYAPGSARSLLDAGAPPETVDR